MLKNEELIISISDNEICKKVSELIQHKFGNAIHNSSTICHNVEIGEGNVVFPNQYYTLLLKYESML